MTSKLIFSAILLATTSLVSSANAEMRKMDAHIHGAGDLNVAVDGNKIVMELITPGYDITGFEYKASTEAEKAAVAKAVGQLEDGNALFQFSAGASCALDSASSEIEYEYDEHAHENHDDHAHESHDDHAHEKHDDHAHENHDDHAHENHDNHDHEKHDDHAHEKHDEHAHEKHDEHAHDDHAHEKHDEPKESEHLEFHTEYSFTCQNMDSLTEISTNYFETFPNAEKLLVQIATQKGSGKVELTKDNHKFDL